MSDLEQYDHGPEKKQFFNELDQEVDAAQRTKAQSESERGVIHGNPNEVRGVEWVWGIRESEIEIETNPSEVTGTKLGCGENDDKIKLLSEAHHLAHGGLISHDLKDYLSTKTPILENTVLHIAAWYGNDDVVDLVAKDAPILLFSFNKNGDTPLHVCARAGNIPMVKKLLAAYANFQRREIADEWIKYKRHTSVKRYNARINMGDLLELVKEKNVEGNTMLHEAMVVVSGKKKSMNIGANFFQAFEPYETRDREGESLSESCYKYALNIANNANKSALYLVVEAGDQEAVKLILDKCPQNAMPMGSLSPVVAAVMKQDEGMLKIILSKRPNWIHLEDTHGRLPLHYAASTGYLEGVVELLDKCKCCSIQKDKYGYFPLHLASHGGHLRVVAELLKYCPDPTEMLDSYKRNVLHIAAKSGKLMVVRYILQMTNERHEMIINQKDSRGDTPLHLAIRSCHFETVERLIRDSRVDLGMVNQKKETALDIASALYQVNKSSLGQKLIWDALKSAVAKPSSERVRIVESRPSDLKPNEKVYPRTDTMGKILHRSWTNQTFKDGILRIS